MNLVIKTFWRRFFLVFAILFTIGIWNWNYLVTLIFQTRGGLVIDDLLSSNGSHQYTSIACLREDNFSSNQKSSLVIATNSLIRAMRHNQSSQLFLLLGRAYCLLGDYRNSVEAYRQYTILRPDNPLGHIELGFAYEALFTQEISDQKELLSDFETFKYEQIQELWTQTREASAVSEWQAAGIDADDFLFIGNLSSKEKQFAEALVWYERALWVQLDSTSTWIAIASVFEEMNDPEKALRAYWTAYYFNPEAGAIDLVEALNRQGDVRSIENILTDILHDYPDSSKRYQWWDILSRTVVSQERWPEVERLSRQALIENPHWVKFHINLGWALYYQNAVLEAVVQEFNQAIEIDPSQPEGYFAMAQLLTKEKRYLEADPYYELAIERKSDDKWYSLSRATNARSAGNLPLAFEIFDDLLERFPKYERAYYEIAWAYHLSGQTSKAKEAIIQVISMTDSPSEGYLVRAGLIFEASGEKNKALDFFKWALKINPANIAASEGAARLDN